MAVCENSQNDLGEVLETVLTWSIQVSPKYLDAECSHCENMTMATLRSRKPPQRLPASVLLPTLALGAIWGSQWDRLRRVSPRGPPIPQHARLPRLGFRLSPPARLTASSTSCSASALHAMALLQVHQAKALKELHEGSSAPDLMQELHSATDLALRATKVMARSLGQTMSSLVVQEHHLWLNLVEMGEADKTRFLAAPISQAGLFGDNVEDFAQQFLMVKQQTEVIRHILPLRGSRSRTPSARHQGRPPAVTAPAPPQPAPSARPRHGAHRRKQTPPVSRLAAKNPRRSSKRP
ncbi:uncharacterized protein LOC127429137 [Myxocyprinus asiaticus]|uniref:uncharacterized protein LOC127429137 n=1 Tax=Myxocyprinus asiaticus TaxID=70543 RepID=UPI002223C73F|nr:uncharacterized protein LOC127429137 [Myxocyprinus asiaticus]